ncbi:MAG: L,D-transpeptidase catalytic domain [Thermomicrobiales bacterium]|nr:L,D-transpeptidase catalytic domain [Thermomicrobiales bacterium]
MGRGRLAGGGRQSRACGVVGWLAAIVVAIAITVGAPAGTRAVWQGERLALLAGPTPDDWYHVQAGDQTGWAFGALLAFDGASDALGQGGLGVTGSAERWVDVDRTRQMVTLYEGDSAVATYWAAMGSDPSDDGFFATAVGTYWVYEKGFHTYLMDAAGQVIPGGDGPTGGCVALAPTAADELFAFVSVGTRVEVHD